MEFTGIHNTAIIHEKAQIGHDVTIGPFAVIGANVTLEDKVHIGSSVLVEGYTTIGAGTKVFPKAMIGTCPQDLKYKGEKSYIKIGTDNAIRECVTINPGTHEGEVTQIGDNNLIMAYCHIAHNCIIGNNVIMANCATLAGHVTMEDCSVIGGLAAVHQFVKIGSFSMIGGCSAVHQDVLPFCMLDGNPGHMVGLNSTGLKRRGFSSEERLILKKAYRFLFREKHTVSVAVDKIKKELPENDHIKMILEFIEKSERGITR